MTDDLKPSDDIQKGLTIGTKEKFSDILQKNIFWTILTSMAIAVSGAIAVISYIDRHISDRLELIIPSKVRETVEASPYAGELRVSRQEAAKAADNYRSQADAARIEFAKAQENSERATRIVSEIRLKSEQIQSLINLSDYSNKIEQILSKPEFREQIINQILQPGAIMAFDTIKGCPTGWSSYDKAAGRFLVGAGAHINLDKNGANLSKYDVGAIGGEEKHKLTISEMPVHQHKQDSATRPGQGVYGEYASGPFLLQAATRNSVEPGVLVSKEGGDQPHNVMPPFIAVQWCKRN